MGLLIVTSNKNRVLRYLEDFPALLLLKMTSLRCWLQPPMLDLKTVRQPWNNISSRRQTKAKTLSTWRRHGRRSFWPLVLSQQLRTQPMFMSVLADLTLRELSSSSPDMLAAAPLLDVSLLEPSLIRSRLLSVSPVSWSSVTQDLIISQSPREAMPISLSLVSATLILQPSSLTLPFLATTNLHTALD